MSLTLSDLGEIFNIATGIVTLITLIILIYQIKLQRDELKTNSKETAYNTYEKLLGDFSSTTLALLDHPDVLDLTVAGSGRPKKWVNYSETQKKACCYFDSLIALLERVYVGVPHSRPHDDWETWRIWVADLSTNALFVDTFDENKKMYGSDFVKEIETIIAETRSTKIVSPNLTLGR